MPLTAPAPALLAVELPLAPGLIVLSLLGAALALQAWRAGLASAGRALLGASLPVTLWLLLAALNPAHPTRLLVTPLGAGLASSFCCGLAAALRAARRGCCSAQRSVDCYLWSCAAALLAARLLDWLGKSGSEGGVWVASNSELSASGALIGAATCAWWCFRQQPLLGRAWLDACAPALGLALALGWGGAYLQDPTRGLALAFAAAGLALTSLSLTFSTLQRCHGQTFVLTALGYGIVQLSDAWLAPAGAGTRMGWVAAVAAGLLIVLALVAGWVWRKAFTSSGI